jgi:hypothetical protein
VWWKDDWNPLNFGRDFDFNRSFFEQFEELMKVVPHRNLMYFQNENSDYNNFGSHNKDCYLLFSSDDDKGCFYSSNLQKCVDCVDCSIGNEDELCYECFNFHHCYKCLFSSNVENCSDFIAAVDCKGCRDCAFSYGLRNKQFCIYNKQYSKDQYFQFMATFDTGDRNALKVQSEKFKAFLLKQPHRALSNLNNQNSVGDYLYNSKNCFECFNVTGSEDSRYVSDSVDCRDCLDCNEVGHSELCYETIDAFPDTYNSKFLVFSANTSNIEYCYHCYNSHDVFACVGLKHNEYCILNKQYSKDEYIELRAKIVEHLKKTGEWGQQFPASISPFAYNETIANKWYPLEKNEALKLGFKWKDEDKNNFAKKSFGVPSKISDVKDDILKETLVCEVTSLSYKIIPQEFDFYKKLRIPVPVRCPDQRSLDRGKLMNPRHIYDRNCGKCGEAMKTTYAPNCKEIVYCEKCYMETVY